MAILITYVIATCIPWSFLSTSTSWFSALVASFFILSESATSAMHTATMIVLHAHAGTQFNLECITLQLHLAGFSLPLQLLWYLPLQSLYIAKVQKGWHTSHPCMHTIGIPWSFFSKPDTWLSASTTLCSSSAWMQIIYRYPTAIFFH